MNLYNPYWFYGRHSFDWSIAKQNGLTSTISFTYKFDINTSDVDWIDIGNITVKVNCGGETMTIVELTPQDAKSYNRDIRTGKITSEDEKLRGKVFNSSVNFGSDFAPCTQIQRVSTFDVTRDQFTNQTEFTVTVEYDGVFEYYGTYYNGGNNWGENDFDGEMVTYTEDPILVNTITKSGSAAKITNIVWENDEANPTITYFYDRGTEVEEASLRASIGFWGETDNVAIRTLPLDKASYTFELTDSERRSLWELLDEGETGTVYFYIETTETVDGEEEVLDETRSSTTLVFINYEPTLYPSLTDINPITRDLTGDPNKLVRYMSEVQFEFNAEPQKGALDILSSLLINTLDDSSGQGTVKAENLLSGTFTNPTSNTFYFSATDNRLNTGHTYYSLSSFDGDFIEYVKLTASVKTSGIDGGGNLDITVSGKYFDKKFSENKPNTMSIQYAVYPKGTTAVWNDIGVITPTVPENSSDYTFTIPTVTGLDYSKQHVVEVRVTDRLMTVTTSTVALATPVFYWNEDEFNFNIPVNINGASVDSVVERNSVNAYYMSSSGSPSSGGFTWNYIKWSSGLLECWCTVPLTTTVNTAWGNMYVAAAQYKTDVTYPVQPVGTPLVMVTLGAGGTKGLLIADNSYAADNVSCGRYNIASPVAITSSVTFRLNYYVRGKWK